MSEDYIDGELIGDFYDLTPDNLSKIQWKTKDGEIIYIKDLEDKHLRNIALMLMGFGYTKFHAPDMSKIIWLTILRMEWERRIMAKQGGNAKFRAYPDKFRSQIN